MKRDTILKGFAIIMILGFVIEIFIIALPGQGGYEEPAATPTVTAVPRTEFLGSALANATIEGLGQRLLVRCNTTELVAAELQALPNVSNAAQDQQQQIIDIGVAENASVLATLTSLRTTLSKYCSPFFLQQAYLSFPGDVTFTPFNASNNKTFGGRTLGCIEDSAVCFAFVLPSHRVGDSVNLDIAGRFIGDNAYRLFGQEQLDATFEIRSVQAPARVTFVENGGKAEAEIPWEKRDVNLSRLYDDLFSRNEFQYETDYKPVSIVTIAGNVSNETVEGLKNLSFVKGLNTNDEGAQFFAEDNFTNRSWVVQALQAKGINASRVSFPASPFSIVVATTNVKDTVAFLESRLGTPATFRRNINVRFLDPQAVEDELRASFPEKEDAFPILVPLNTTLNGTLNVSVTAVIQYGEVATSSVKLVP